jgi:hypothetical protein
MRSPPLQAWNAPTRIIIAAEAYFVYERWLRGRPQNYGDREPERLLPGALVRGSRISRRRSRN